MTTPKKPSQKKSEVALTKKRVNGRFVSKDPKALEKKKEELERNRIALEGFNDQDRITEEDREYFGTDSLLFLERALAKAPTWYEALKYAKELVSRQHPTLQSIQSKSESTVTRVLRWDWEEDPSAIEMQTVEAIEHDTTMEILDACEKGIQQDSRTEEYQRSNQGTEEVKDLHTQEASEQE